MSDHPIEALMKTAMESIKEMVDVNTVIGDPVETPDGSVIIPVSRVIAGFASGGGEFDFIRDKKDDQEAAIPFAGGSGVGLSVQPVGFLVVGNNQVRMLPIDGNAVLDRLIDLTPQVISQIQSAFRRTRKGDEGLAPSLQGGV
ncbi:MAG: GerW family sporulation protein [Bacillota bacterium]